MAYELEWWPEADAAMDALEADASASAVVDAIHRVLDRLEGDPFNPRLGTITFHSPLYGGVCATPTRLDDWFVIWQRGPTADVLDVILVHQLDVGSQR